MQISQVLNAVANVNGASFVSISTVTTPKLTGGKSNPHQGRVQKVMTSANVMVFQNKNSNGYENMVNRRLIAEGKILLVLPSALVNGVLVLRICPLLSTPKMVTPSTIWK